MKIHMLHPTKQSVDGKKEHNLKKGTLGYVNKYIRQLKICASCCTGASIDFLKVELWEGHTPICSSTKNVPRAK